MRILFPVLGFGRAGGERVLSKLASGLIGKGHEVFFVVPKNRENIYYPTLATIVTSKTTKYKIKYISFVVNYYNLFRTCYKLECDVVVASYHITCFLSVLLQRRVKKYYYVQANEVNFTDKFLARLIAKFTYFLPLRKIVNSDRILAGKLNNYVSLVPAGVDVDLFKHDSRRPFGSAIKIGVVGRKEPFKGTREIIEAIDVFCSQYNGRVELNVAIYLPEIEVLNIESVSKCEIGSDRDLASFYKENDIIIAAGLIEDGAFHYPCAEAMCSGCIVISNYAPLTDTISQFKIEKLTKNAIVKKLFLAVNINQDERVNEIMRNKLEIDNYAWPIVVNKFEAALLS